MKPNVKRTFSLTLAVVFGVLWMGHLCRVMNVDLLLMAVQKRDINSVHCLLVLGTSAQTTSEELRIPVLNTAAQNGDLEMMSELLAYGAKLNQPDDFGNTPLINAALIGHTAAAHFLLDSGADVKLPNAEGDTPLIIAARTGNIEAVQLFLNKGAEVNAVNKQNITALMAASHSGNEEARSVLLQSGARENKSVRHKEKPG